MGVNQDDVSAWGQPAHCQGTCALMPLVFEDRASHCVLEDKVRPAEQVVAIHLDKEACVVILSDLEGLSEELDKEIRWLGRLRGAVVDLFETNSILPVHDERMI